MCNPSQKLRGTIGVPLLDTRPVGTARRGQGWWTGERGAPAGRGGAALSLAAALVLLLAAPPTWAQGGADLGADDGSPHSAVTLVAEVSAAAPGAAFDAALRIEQEPGWHVYWTNPGDAGLPPDVAWRLPEGVRVGPLRHPAPHVVELAGVASYAHEGTPFFLSRVAVPPDFEGDSLRLAGTVDYLICADVCLPATEEVSLAVPIAGATVRTGALDAARAALPTKGAGWTAAAAATDGGYALTLAPPDAWAGSLDGAHFFPAEKAVLDHAAAQDFVREGRAWAVALAGSPYAEAPAERLPGVLVAPPGETFPDGARAIEVDAIVAGGAVASSAAGGAAGLGLGAALGLALLGGLLLNLMPCVFPILSIKVLGFVQGRDASPAALRAHGLAFGAGVVVSFLALAGALLALRAAGAGLGWGFQLQSPPVVAALAVLMTGLALSLLGVVEVGQGLAAAGGRLDRRQGLGGAFLSGVLATVVATPCTAPFMGAALGFALAQPALAALAVFATLGVGMALPYVALSFRPALVQRLPRPGPWMETLKQALAFPLFATAAWLVWVFARQVGADGAGLLLLALVLVGLGAWAWGRWPRVQTRAGRRAARALGLLAAGGAVALVVLASGLSPAPTAPPDDGAWRPFDAEAVAALVDEGRPVFVDVTAAWCLTCQVNKKTALGTDAVRDAFERAGVTTVRADWTNRDAEITAFLDRFGRSGVPLYVYFPGGAAEPVLLPELLTPSLVVDAVEASEVAAAL
ncbi:protein-disulfide reductase DsbD family protein [Rubrivirga litoralis]|uniref:Thioredoxin family protein n=1 Tax=Rubrivirga litoralis TaxID=3075598 RepID=A0ABU3BNR8_9BACT|nr:thioredoxin family protein [Rubrivirga sp. F394]MDT0630861.1 thioredoxin family protein [Rubrivirga sp. F394]